MSDREMASLLDRIHPAYYTSRRDYRLVCAGYLAVLVTIWAFLALSMRPFSTSFAISGLAVEFASGIILLLATIRRLRDAGASVLWAMLFFFPFQIGWDVLDITLRMPTFSGFSPPPISFRLIELQPLIALVPILIGLARPSQAANRRKI